MTEKYDLVVIGAGPGGYVAAIHGAKKGLRTAVIEQGKSGGTCLNRGCIPTKAMIHAAGEYRRAREGGRFGVSASSVKFDYEEILKYRQETVESLVSGVDHLLKTNGVTVIRGKGRLEKAGEGGSGHIVSADTGEERLMLEAGRVILAAGSEPAGLPITGADLPGVVNSDGLFAMDHAPESLVIIGGGVIGMEFATVFTDLGTEVTVLEALPRILENFDKEISRNLQMIMKKRGTRIQAGVSVKEIRPSAEDPSKLVCVYEGKGGQEEAEADTILIAAGRRPVTEGLFSTDIPLAFDGKFIAVDENMQTCIPGIYAIGDLIGGMQLAHEASAEGTRAAQHIAMSSGLSRPEGPDAGEKAQDFREQEANPFHQDLRVIPGCVYTDPEIAVAGMDEEQAKESGEEYAVGKFIMSANGKSLITGEERGFIKVIASADSGRILGAQMMCARATDMIGEFVTAIANSLTVDDMLRGVRAHPTYSEGIGEALEDVFGESTHTAPKKRR